MDDDQPRPHQPGPQSAAGVRPLVAVLAVLLAVAAIGLIVLGYFLVHLIAGY